MVKRLDIGRPVVSARDMGFGEGGSQIVRMLRAVIEKLDPRASDEMAIAQVVALQKRVPILYSILATNTFLLAATHYGRAEAFLTVYIPAALIAVMLYRAIHWHRIDLSSLSPNDARRHVERITILSSVFSLILMLWSSMIYESSPTLGRAGHISAHGQAVLYVGLTVVCGISLLMHARAAAVLTTLIVLPPFCLLMVLDGTSVEIAVAVNLALAAAAMLYWSAP